MYYDRHQAEQEAQAGQGRHRDCTGGIHKQDQEPTGSQREQRFLEGFRRVDLPPVGIRTMDGTHSPQNSVLGTMSLIPAVFWDIFFWY